LSKKSVARGAWRFLMTSDFLPKTKAPDGDPIDVLLLMDEPAFPGCAVRAARLIGIIEGEQVDGKRRIRKRPAGGDCRGQSHVCEYP